MLQNFGNFNAICTTLHWVHTPKSAIGTISSKRSIFGNHLLHQKPIPGSETINLTSGLSIIAQSRGRGSRTNQRINTSTDTAEHLIHTAYQVDHRSSVGLKFKPILTQVQFYLLKTKLINTPQSMGLPDCLCSRTLDILGVTCAMI